jgi:hypothetical protein
MKFSISAQSEEFCETELTQKHLMTKGFVICVQQCLLVIMHKFSLKSEKFRLKIALFCDDWHGMTCIFKQHVS